MTRRLNPIVILAIVAQLLLVGCGAAAPADAAATVNGEPVPSHYYDVLVTADQRRVEQVGLAVDWTSANGAHRLSQIQVGTIKRLVHNSVVAQVAKSRGVDVSDSDLDAAMGKVEGAFGGADAVDQKLQQSGLTRDDFRSLYRYFLLDQKLRQSDPNGYPAALDQAMKDAKVQVYVAPCLQNHDYSQCVNGVGA